MKQSNAESRKLVVSESTQASIKTSVASLKKAPMVPKKKTEVNAVLTLVQAPAPV